ncbi:MAG TPA: serine/threonine-protein kinase, partial [Planctomycetaceae bacterium]|nr:serine/threonine-protein kinase [Planctomycetaceae bacterium]
MTTARTIGPFEIEKQLGIGGMGIVYLAKYVKTGKHVALKVLTPALSADDASVRPSERQKALKRFEREMEILQKLRHDNIVRYYGGGSLRGQHFYAMEVMTGGTVERLLRKKGRLPWEQVIDFGLQISRGLEHAHRAGVIHRDLKPANLFLTKDGRLKLGDFGIARDLQATALTAAGSTVGTYAYMAPEQITGRAPISSKTDLYALGCVMYQMLTGHTPFEGKSMGEIFTAHLTLEPKRVTADAIDCPIWLESVVMKLLSKDPDDRYYDALAVQAALQEVFERVARAESVVHQAVGGGPTATAATVVAPAERTELQRLVGRRRRRKKRAVPAYERLWFLFAVLAVLVGGVAWATWPLSERQLFERADALMATNDPNQWRTAREKFLEPLLERFPDGPYAARAREHIDEIEIDKLSGRVRNLVQINREARSEAERLLAAAWRDEQRRDRIAALAQYRGLIELLKDREKDRHAVALARRRVEAIQNLATSEGADWHTLVNDKLRQAEELDASGQRIKADAIWSSIVTLYDGNREFERQVEYARARRMGQDVAPFD